MIPPGCIRRHCSAPDTEGPGVCAECVYNAATGADGIAGWTRVTGAIARIPTGPLPRDERCETCECYDAGLCRSGHPARDYTWPRVKPADWCLEWGPAKRSPPSLRTVENDWTITRAG